MMVVGGRDRFFLDLGPTVAPLLFAVVGVEILRRGDLLPLSPVLVEVSKIISILFVHYLTCKTVEIKILFMFETV